MKLLVNGKELPILAASAHESLDQYYPYYLITVQVQIPTNKVVVETDVRSTYYIMRAELNRDVYVYTLVADTVYQILNRTYPAYSGTTSLSRLLATLSIKNEISSSTGQEFWRVPAFKFTGLLDHLSQFTVVSNGGAPKFFLDLNGVLQLYDLRQILSRNNPTKISAFGMESDLQMSDWILGDVGEVSISSGSSTGIRSEKFVIEQGMGLGSASINDTTDNEVSLLKRLLTTSYYSKRYTARRVVISDAIDSLNIGDLVSIDGVAKFVVYSRSVTIPLNKEPAQCSYILVSNIS